MRFDGRKVAVAGMGVSGLGLARAVKALGGTPVVFDQKQNDNPAVMSAVDSLDAIGVAAVTGWHGRLDPKEFDLLLVSPGFPRQHPAIRDMQNGGREIWSEVEFAYRVSKAPILAITGTNGKSTTTVMLWTILNGSGSKAILCGNIAGSGYPEQTLTDAAMSASESDFLVAEISSYQLEWVIQFKPLVAAITNITPDHMDRYKEFEDYYNTKLRMFDRMGAGDTVVVNLDEAGLARSIFDKQSSGSAAAVGFSPSGKEQANGVSVREGAHLSLSGMPVEVPNLPFTGEHNVTNAMMAWEMAARVASLDSAALDALMSFSGLANRMEQIGQRDGIVVVNNSMCTNPAAVIASSKGVSRAQHLLMGGVTKNLDFRPVGEYLKGTPHKVYVFGPDPDRMNEMLGNDWPSYDSMGDAFQAATEAAKAGEAVLLAPGCASAEPYLNFKERGEAFRQMAKDWVEGKR